MMFGGILGTNGAIHRPRLCLLVWFFASIVCPSHGIDLNSRHGSKNGVRTRFGFGRHDAQDRSNISVAVVLPYSTFMEREYNKQILKASMGLSGMRFLDQFVVAPYLDMVQPIPAPTEVLQKICDNFLANNTAVILYFTHSENYGRDSMASQYFMQLSQYVGLPLISWNADNSAFEHAASSDRLQLQLAPTIKHQAAAILTLLERYGWNYFSIVTGEIAGHHNFQQVLRELVLHRPEGHSKKVILDTVVFKEASDLSVLARSEARVFILYSTNIEAISIMKEARRLRLTRKAYVWIVTQSVIGSSLDAPREFPVGMLGVHFNTDRATMTRQVKPAMDVLAHALDRLVTDPNLSETEKMAVIHSNISCDGRGQAKWAKGELLYQLLRNVSILDGKRDSREPALEFNKDGSRKAVELKIVNLQPEAGDLENSRWEEIGVWKSWTKPARSLDDNPPKLDTDHNTKNSNNNNNNNNKSNSYSTPSSVKNEKLARAKLDERLTFGGGLDIKDIVWPGMALKPPEGIPEKRFIRVSFLEEDPYVLLTPPTTCGTNKGVVCQMVDYSELIGVNTTEEKSKVNSTMFQCCSGFCVDLLLKFAHDLSFDFHMVRVRDGNWGGVANGKWNGLVAELINHETDIVMTSLKINSGREKVIDFSVPFLDTGITILVAKRTGIISPTAFLEPFDTASWMLVALVAIQVAAGCIFFFEWLSPAGYNMKVQSDQGRFSFLRTLWLVWAVLFQAAVNVDCPRGYTARFMAHVWAMFALIFLAIYTANLAAFMITREEFTNLSGLEDRRLTNPQSTKPPFRFGTIPNGATDYVLKNNFPEMHSYMKQFNRSTVKEGFKSIKTDQLDAFIYDATVLEYLVGQDDECNILTVGSWYAMTGYGVAFPKGSKWVPLFNEYLMSYRENGDLERMQRFWFTGACEPKKRRRTSSKPLALAQFTSAFILLGLGIILSGVLLLCEHGYFKYLRPHMSEFRRKDWISLISLSVADSLKDGNKVFRSPKLKSHSLPDQGCKQRISGAQHDLTSAKERIKLLEGQLQHLRSRLPLQRQSSQPSVMSDDHALDCVSSEQEDFELSCEDRDWRLQISTEQLLKQMPRLRKLKGNGANEFETVL
ncbi:hypothetical protein TCAL_11017 [Tigriopus californicus]|uniref:Glutamate receptor ionotropic, NMDA 2B n=1 Tax=Tigriopus californicus TaxID=6832 RepID=A0A553NSR0_TIGCA|nr:hypothetical protein TCAL_11017 [Tigriopus californicus]